MNSYTDTKMLDWMLFHGAKVYYASDDEFCWIEWSDRDGRYSTKGQVGWRARTPREHISAAMLGHYTEV